MSQEASEHHVVTHIDEELVATLGPMPQGLRTCSPVHPVAQGRCVCQDFVLKPDTPEPGPSMVGKIFRQRILELQGPGHQKTLGLNQLLRGFPLAWVVRGHIFAMQGRMAGLGSRKGLANAKSSECISVTISRIKFLLSCAKSTPIHLGALPLLSLSLYIYTSRCGLFSATSGFACEFS